MRNLLTIILLFTCSLVFGQGATPNLRSGLVGYWKLEETSGTTANDERGVFDGTSTNVTVNQTGKVGKCYDFPGNAYITMGNNLDFDSDEAWSMAAWINPDSHSSFGAIMSKMQSSGFYTGYYLSTNTTTGALVPIIRGSASNNRILIISSLSVTIGEGWAHVVLTYDGSEDAGGVYVYKNGSVDGSPSVSENTLSTSTSSSAPFNIGSRDNSTSTAAFDGQIDEPMMFNREISALEVKQLYNSGSGLLYVQENFKNNKNYEKLINYVLGHMYFGLITCTN